MLAGPYKKGVFPLSFLLCAFFALGASYSPAGQAASPPQLSAVVSPSVDLDGDGVNESVQTERLGLHEHISFTLSHNSVFTVLQFVPKTHELGVLSMQDADGD